MEIKLDSGRKVKLKESISLDERDSLRDGLEWELDENGKIKSMKLVNSTMTKWIRACVDGDTSDEELLKWSMTERTDVFSELQNKYMVGEEKASK